MKRRQVVGGLIAGGVAAAAPRVAEPSPPQPDSFGGTYVHTFLLNFLGLSNGQPVYAVVQTSEGPFMPDDAAARAKEIGEKGLFIVTQYFPVHLVQRVELRSQ